MPMPSREVEPVALALPKSTSVFASEDVRRIASCLRQIQEAEHALTGARGLLLDVGTAEDENKRLLEQTATTWQASACKEPVVLDLNVDLEAQKVWKEPSAKASRFDNEALRFADALRAPGNVTETSKRFADALRAPGNVTETSKKWGNLDTATVCTAAVVDQVVIDSIDKELESGFVIATSTTLGVTGGLPSALEKSGYVGVVHVDVFWKRIGFLVIPIFHPEAKIRLCWLLLGFLFIVYEAYAIPVYIAFSVNPDGFLFVFVSCINTYFLIDIVASFFSGHMDKTGKVVVEPRLIACDYARSWLVPDLISGIPWEWLGAVVGADGKLQQMTRSVRMFRAARLLRLTRLLHVMKLTVIMDHLETYTESNAPLTFLSGVTRILGLLFAVCHWGACIWYIIGNNENVEQYFEDPLGNADLVTWVGYYNSSYPGGLGDQDKMQSYIFALYFTLTTMTTVGYGDITPKNGVEVGFALCLLCCSSIVFAGLMGTLTDMISSLNNRSHIRAERKLNLSRYMRWRAVPRRLMLSIRQHLLFLWDANEGYDAYEEEVKQELPAVLKAELCYHVYGRILSSAPFFAWMRDYTICTKHLANTVQSIFVEKGDQIFRMGQANEQVYMLLSGTVVVSRNENLFEDSDTQDANCGDVDNFPDFSLPRHKEHAFADISAVVVKAKRMSSTGSTGDKRDKSKDRETEVHYGMQDTGYKIFDSEVLKTATVELRREDVRVKRAATKVQRIWRKKLDSRRAEALRQNGNDYPTKNGPPHQRIKKGLSISRMQSKAVTAPAYFGESCLWQPLKDWDIVPPPPYVYTARCESRGEIIYIPRIAVKDMIERFSPWLPERFEYFRTAVAKGLDTVMDNGDSSRQFAEDFEAADLMMPVDEAALQSMHCKAIARSAPTPTNHSEPNPGDGPLLPRRLSGQLREGPTTLIAPCSRRPFSLCRQGSRQSSNGLISPRRPLDGG